MHAWVGKKMENNCLTEALVCPIAVKGNQASSIKDLSYLFPLKGPPTNEKNCLEIYCAR